MVRKIKRRYKKYHYSEECLNDIREIYNKKKLGIKYRGLDGLTPSQRISIKYKISIGAISKKAIEICDVVPRGYTDRRLRYSDEEKKIIKNKIHLKPRTISEILRKNGYIRSPVAIKCYIKKYRIDSKKDNYMNCSEIAEGFGLPFKTIYNWIKAGYIRPEYKIEDTGRYRITYSEIKRFIFENPRLFDISRVDQIWFLDVIGKIGGSNYAKRE